MGRGRLRRAAGVVAIVAILIALEIVLLERPGRSDRSGLPDNRPPVSDLTEYVDSAGLTWDRCAGGMQVRAGRCTGSATAVEWARAVAFCQRRGPRWRLPSIEEQLEALRCDPYDRAHCPEKTNLGPERARRCSKAARSRPLLFWHAARELRPCIHPEARTAARCAPASRLFRSDCPFFDGERTLLVATRRAHFRCVRSAQ